MKTRFLYLLLLFAAIWSGCEEHDYAEGVLSPYTTIGDVRNLYKGSDVTLTRKNLMDASKFSGVVISNPANGNSPDGLLIIQNQVGSKVKGIAIALETASSYAFGDSLVIDVEGAVLKKVNGSLQLTGISDTKIEVAASNRPVNARAVSSLTLNTSPQEYESTLVQVKSAVVSPAPEFGQAMTGDWQIMNGENGIGLHVEADAAFAAEDMPASASFAGIFILSQASDAEPPVLQIWPQNLTDITDIIAPPDPNAVLGEHAVIITGFVNDAKGADGNYEYFQFMATQDIDFTKTPMSVITCTNAGSAQPYAGAAAQQGWATGGGRTYKFNLTSGTVKKGEFFYVGGSRMLINGPNSTDIEDAKWIKTIDYVNNAGDGIGDKSGGLLPNSGNAGGIAIFEGIDIKESSVPMDAVFYGGTGKTTMVDLVNGYGYRVPKNEHYNPVDPDTSIEQPFFYQGTNQYVIPHAAPADQGIFVKLGGEFDVTTGTWTTPRGHEFFVMTQSTELTEIETNGVTVLSE